VRNPPRFALEQFAMSFIRHSLCAAILSLSATAAQAASVTVEFELDVVGYIPTYASAPGFGTLVYDDANLTGIGEETLAMTAYIADPSDPDDYDVVAGLISFSITMFAGETYEQTFTASDDVWPDVFPEFYFFDGDLYGIEFYVSEEFTPIMAPGVYDLGAFFDCGCSGDFYYDSVSDTNVLEVEVNAIPVPAALPLMLGGLGLLGLLARRRKG
jgi:hypothetical protein